MSMTSLDSLAIGSTCASRTVDTHGNAALFGMVVDIGVHESDGTPYVIVLNEVPAREIRVAVYHKGAKHPMTPGVARLRQIDLTDIDPDSIEEPKSSRMQGWARKAMLGEVVLPGEPFALASVAAMLEQEARKLWTSRGRDGDELEAELRDRLEKS